MAKKKLPKSILIVCEGTKTEHDYFEYIAKNISIPRGVWNIVDVCDNNTLPSDFPIPSSTELGNRKKRCFINPNKRKISAPNVLKELCIDIYGEKDAFEKYDNIKAVPLRYVAQAQLIEKRQQMYDELWAVFDKDKHTHHEEAFKKAQKEINNKKVQIGFSSRSFEHWLILHFEKINRPFLKSECKNEKGVSLDCDSTQGCEGETCLVGYIKTHTPLVNYQKSNNPNELEAMMSVLLQPENLQQAFQNAIWLRDEIQKDPSIKDKKCYELNPYTDVDVLVKRLIET